MSVPSPERLAQLFERELRRLEPVSRADSPPPRHQTPRVSQELEAQVAEFAAETRSRGATPEQMLVQLKQALASVAPDVPRSRRTELVSQVTGRAINAFFGR